VARENEVAGTGAPGGSPGATDTCRSCELLVDFANTAPHGNEPVELLGDAAGLSAWAVKSGLMEDGSPVTQADVVAALELRDAFGTVFRAHSGCPGGAGLLPGAEEYLRRIADRYPLTVEVAAGGCRFIPARTGVLGAFAGILAAAADLSYRGAWARMKTCKNDSCHSGFFDRTRNSSGLYCSTACGSQASQRAYRNRLKGNASCA
jgi:predicted RNA-binding Zn ribbon-like protein